MELEFEFGGVEIEIKGMQGLATLAGLALLAAAVARELSRPAELRTWHGQLLGFVPYDLRPPTLERARATLWNPDDPRVLVPALFGVGWSMNLARLARDLRALGAR
jgi:hypothetical protein